MAVKLNHTIVHSRNREEAAAFYAEIFGLPGPKPFGPFLALETANEVALAFLGHDAREAQPYASLAMEAQFDHILGGIKSGGADYWADPGRKVKGKINRHDGGRGVYFLDPSGHVLEIITRPYGASG